MKLLNATVAGIDPKDKFEERKSRREMKAYTNRALKVCWRTQHWTGTLTKQTITQVTHPQLKSHSSVL